MKVGIIGASGYRGQELVSLLIGHPEAGLSSFFFCRQSVRHRLGQIWTQQIIC